ncbi:MAG: SGNH/GDSL hydrolase family protein [Lacunisphaera sp.]|nr:SGNH/GDSL hydrolase family protein [Lacunisphaera sp.]
MFTALLAAALLFAAGCTSQPIIPAAPPASTALAPAANPLAGKRVLVLGDSITQDGRYVTFLEYYLQRLAPGAKCDLISIGLSSETVSGLTEPGATYPRPCALERLDRALKAAKPQLVLACYGMNDGIYAPSSPERLAAFNDGVRQLIATVRATGAELILITPPVFDPVPLAGKTVPATAARFGYGSAFYEGYDGVLAEFAAAEMSRHGLAGVTVIDLHTPMAAALAARRATKPTFTFAKDGVHPGDAGHLLMARIIGAALGLPLPATEPDSELARINADPIFDLVSTRRRLRSEAWLPFVGYTRDMSFKSAAVDASERAAKLLQGQIDARLAEAKR